MILTLPSLQRWPFYLSLLQLPLSIGVLVYSILDGRSYPRINCAVPTKFHFNTACACISIAALLYFILLGFRSGISHSTAAAGVDAYEVSEKPKQMQRKGWWSLPGYNAWIALTLQWMLFILWCTQATISRQLDCADICGACGYMWGDVHGCRCTVQLNLYGLPTTPRILGRPDGDKMAEKKWQQDALAVEWGLGVALCVVILFSMLASFCDLWNHIQQRLLEDRQGLHQVRYMPQSRRDGDYVQDHHTTQSHRKTGSDAGQQVLSFQGGSEKHGSGSSSDNNGEVSIGS